MKGESNPTDDRPVAYRVEFSGSPTYYPKSFEGTGFGVVFEDDGETGYIYATNDKADKIFDALHLYNSKNPNKLSSGDKFFIVWNPKVEKAGTFYHNKFQAIIDFKNRLGCCRTGFPPKFGTWLRSLHTWNDQMVKGLE